MKPEKAHKSIMDLIAEDSVYDMLDIARIQEAFAKKLGRLKLLESMMRENARDITFDNMSEIGVFYERSQWATILEELQAVIADINGR